MVTDASFSENHLPPLELPFGTGTKARWSKRPAGRLLVFVHGFKGAAITTWGDLPDRLCLRREATGYDVIRFGYPSLKGTASDNAAELQGFLDELLIGKNIVGVVNQSIRSYEAAYLRPKSWKYSQVVLVGHSLGACVIRRAVLDQVRSGRSKWQQRLKLIWFAPAHCGARIFRLLTAVSLGVPIPRLSGVLDRGAKYFVPVLADLEEDSSFLKQLLEQTESLCDTETMLKAPLTIWAGDDKVVINRGFGKDVMPPKRIAGVNHITVCKGLGAAAKTIDMLAGQL